MKVVVRAILIVAIILLGYLCWRSIQGPIDFNHQADVRDKAVVARLVDIRNAQVAYRDRVGKYTASFDTLINFIKTGRMASVSRYGDLTEAQMEAGMTEQRAMSIIRTGNVAAIKAAGLWDDANNRPQLSRDSIFAPVSEVLFGARSATFNVDSIQYVPFGNGKRFEMGVANIQTASGYSVPVFEAKTLYTDYLGDLDKKMLGQRIQAVLDKPEGRNYPGMKVGSLTEANNNAGNWE